MTVAWSQSKTEIEGFSCQNILMRNVQFSVILSLQLHVRHEIGLRIVVVGMNQHLFAVWQLNAHAVEQRDAEHIFIAAWTYRIEAHGAEHIPAGHAAVILVAREAVKAAVEQVRHQLFEDHLG